MRKWIAAGLRRRLFSQPAPTRERPASIAFLCALVGQFETHDAPRTYDPKTYRVLKRVTNIKSGGKDAGSVVEKYEELTHNADIPDETFKLPEDKKEEPSAGLAAIAEKAQQRHEERGLQAQESAACLRRACNPVP